MRSTGKHLLPVHVNAMRTRLRKAIERKEDLGKVRKELIKTLKELLRDPSKKEADVSEGENTPDRDEIVEAPMTKLFNDLSKEEMMELAVNGDIYFEEGTPEHTSICEIRIAENLPLQHENDKKTSGGRGKHS